MAGSLDLDLFHLEEPDLDLLKSHKTSHATGFFRAIELAF